MFKHRLRTALEKLNATKHGHDKHGNNGYVELNGVNGGKKEKYHIGKMSYDEWYISPYRRNRTERDPFPDGTLWEKSDTAEFVDLLEANGYYLQ